MIIRYFGTHIPPFNEFQFTGTYKIWANGEYEDIPTGARLTALLATDTFEAYNPQQSAKLLDVISVFSLPDAQSYVGLAMTANGSIHVSNGSAWNDVTSVLGGADFMSTSDFYRETIAPSGVSGTFTFGGSANSPSSAVVAKSTIPGLTGYDTSGYALRLTTTGVGTCRADKNPVSITGMSPNSVIVLALWCPVALDASDVIRFIGFDGTNSPVIVYQQSAWFDGLNYITLDGTTADIALNGTNTYDRIELQSGTGAKTIYVLDMYHYVRAPTTKNITNGGNAAKLSPSSRFNPRMILEFDDAFSSIYTTAFPIMRDLGLTGTIAVIRDVVGKTSAGTYTSPFGVTISDAYTYCTEAQIREMQAAGWELVVHGYNNHANAPLNGNYNLIYEDIKANQEYVKSLGGNHLSYVYPGGNVVPGVSAEVCQALGMKSARVTSKSLDFVPGLLGDPQPFRSRSFAISAGIGLTQLQTMLTRGIRGGLSMRFYGHRIVTPITDAPNEMIPSEFTTLCQQIALAKNNGTLAMSSVEEYEKAFGLR